MAIKNEWHVIGRLGRDPETRQTASGATMASFSLAVYAGKDKEGNALTNWFDFVAFGAVAETLAARHVKGQELYCVARVGWNSWTDADGRNVRKPSFVCNDVALVEREEAPVKEREGRVEKPRNVAKPQPVLVSAIAEEEFPF